MTYRPIALSGDEIKEIASTKEVQDMWDVFDSEQMGMALDQSYAAKFCFMDSGPGYMGDLFVIQPDSLDVAPVRLIRDKDNKLKILR